MRRWVASACGSRRCRRCCARQGVLHCCAALPVTRSALLRPALTHAQVTSSKFVSSAYTPQQLSPPQGPEVAVLGRSNAGKSSLVNYLLTGSSSSSNLAKVSSVPGVVGAWVGGLRGRGLSIVGHPRRTET
jgi:hypothetical protein